MKSNMAKGKKKERMSLTKYDPVESPEDIISQDKDTERREAFRRTYEAIAKIVPNYFMEQRKKRKNGTSGGTSFSQNIIVTSEKATVQTNETKTEENKDVKKEKERDD